MFDTLIAMRWPTVEEEGSSALFDADALADRHVGRGEFAGMEFLHVNAKKIINEVPGPSRMPFRFTINAYRGCSHACTYCMAGETPILMGDGRTKPLARVRPGDVVYGVIRGGAARRYVTTAVLDHWSTSKPAWRVTLADGTELVAGGDHRFLTEGGWKHVVDGEAGSARRPHLTPEDRLIGVRRLAATGAPGRRLELDAGEEALDVVAVEPLGVEQRLYDLTTGTGNFIANGVVSHNCFARPTHDYLGLGIGEDFERKIVVKVNAVERLRAELAAGRWAGHHIAMGTNTDPYQRCEGKYHLTQGIVRVLGEAANPFSILTKSTLILRDLDLLAEAARCTDVRVNLSIGTLDDEVWRLSEPGTPRPLARVGAVRRLNEAGVACGVLVAPVLPGLSDRDDQLREVVDACIDAGAVSISSVALHLRPGVKEHYLGWLRSVRPELVEATEARYRRAYLPKADQHELGERVRSMVDASRQGRWQEPRAVRSVDGASTERLRLHMGGEVLVVDGSGQGDSEVEQLTLGW
jgi:DNA repair photolyase